MKITKIEDALNKPVLCHDGIERRITKIETGFLHYDFWQGKGLGWRDLGRTYRSQAEPNFIGCETIPDPALA